MCKYFRARRFKRLPRGNRRRARPPVYREGEELVARRANRDKARLWLETSWKTFIA
jgi:hypothetical protein